MVLWLFFCLVVNHRNHVPSEKVRMSNELLNVGKTKYRGYSWRDNSRRICGKQDIVYGNLKLVPVSFN